MDAATIAFVSGVRIPYQVREITAPWIERYNEIRPHDALGSLPPARYRERVLEAETPV